MNFTDKDLKQYLIGIFEGQFNGFNPSLDLYIATAEYLDEGLFEGLGQSLFAMSDQDPDINLAKELRDNIHVFSSFKSHHSAVDLGEMIFDDKGGKRRFETFERLALKYFKITHNQHLKTEFRTSVANARSAKQWQDITRDADMYDYLRYSTAGDERVRPDHEDYDGVTARVDDPIWRRIMPPNGFNCRCDVIQTSKLHQNMKPTPKAQLKKLPMPPKLFDMNAGVDKVIFKPDHPAFTVDQKYKVAAKNNFDLPLLFGKHKTLE